MLEKLKSIGAVTFGLFILLVCLLVCLLLAVVFFLGMGWVTSKLFPWMQLVAGLGFFFLVFVLLPLSFFRATRGFAAVAIVYLSFLFGVRLWMDGLLTTLSFWGVGAVVFGLLLAGVGVVPLGMLAALFHGKWGRLIDLILFTALTYGCRMFALWLETKMGPRSASGMESYRLSSSLDEEI